MAKKAAHIAERKCLASGEVLAKTDLIRFVLDPQNVLTPDLQQTLPGRGLYIRPERALLEQAIAKKQFSRAAKANVIIPDGLMDQLEKLHLHALGNMLGLCKKSGQLVSGLDKIREACQTQKVGSSKKAPAYLLEASDGGADGRKRAIKLVGDLPVLSALTAAEQGHALGRDNAVHIILSNGNLARRVVQIANKLMSLRGHQL